MYLLNVALIIFCVFAGACAFTIPILKPEWSQDNDVDRNFHKGNKHFRLVPFKSCETEAYPPKKRDEVAKFVVDLDAAPHDRWTAVVQKKKHEISALLNYIKIFISDTFGRKIFNFIYDNLGKVTATLPSPYQEEIYGIAEASGIPVPEITMYNIFYELFTFCTSIIIQDPKGRLYHGRNLDFGIFLGWDPKNHSWTVAELLRPAVVQIKWQRKGQTEFESTAFAGYIGILNGVKKGKFTFSLDERFQLNGGYMGLLEWMLFHDYKQKWVTFLTREVMETAQDYEQAEEMLSNSRLLAPVYFILGGTKRGEGAIITRYRDNKDVLYLGSKVSGQGSWFLVETNYDHWKYPPFYDDRRTPAIHCLQQAGQGNASLQLMYNVLSTQPVLNKLTTYTSLMDANSGFQDTWLQSCPDPCWPW